jgi:phosphomannomutase
VRLALSDGFVHWRPSGTEPVIRIYAEAEDERALRARLARAAAQLR